MPRAIGGTLDLVSEDGAFLLYARPEGGIAARELMSTPGLHLVTARGAHQLAR